MALKAPPFPLIVVALQGSADAFVQSSVLTGVTGNVALNCRNIILELSTATVLMGMQTDCEIQLAITRRSKTAMPLYSDPDVIFKWAFTLNTLTSGFAVIEITKEFAPQFDLPIVEETIYAQLDSSNVGTALTGIARLECETDTMTPIDRLNLITRSLT